MIYALIVIYNKHILDSKTFKSIEKYLDKINLIVFDNSIKDFKNKEYCRKNNIKYVSLNKNIGLSKAYNYIIENIKFKDNDYIIILDDDTQLNKSYFIESFKLISKKEYDIILPIIKSNDILISPVNVSFKCRIKTVKNIKEIDLNNISAINSGMIINTKIFKKIKYNEELFLDYVDHDFMRLVRNNNYKIHIMKATIKQNYSRYQINDINSELFRFKIFIKDYKIYCKNCNKLWFYYISIFKYRLLESIKYKSIKFLVI